MTSLHIAILALLLSPIVGFAWGWISAARRDAQRRRDEALARRLSDWSHG